MDESTLWSTLCRGIESTWPSQRHRGVGVVVGCSGGADSVALLRALHALRGPECAGFLVVAHFNHQLRGDESATDEGFVRQLASDLQSPFECERGDGNQRDEDGARQQRRHFLTRVARRRGCRYIALGHTLDDNVETVLHRLMRGTGPAGLTGIAPFASLGSDAEQTDFVIARPMLSTRRELIRDALREQGISWREDSSNASNEYKRNWIRNQLLPQLQTEYPDPTAAIARAIRGQAQWAECLSSLADRWLESNLVKKTPLVFRAEYPSNDAPESGQAVVVEALRQCWIERGWPLQSMGMPQWDALYRLLIGQGGSALTLPGNVHANLRAGFLTLTQADRR
ncbi:MAG: tRNA lysidine(34) synthetase TilS [Planctomycetota bacterium]